MNLTRIEFGRCPISGKMKVYKHSREICGCKDCQADRKVAGAKEKFEGLGTELTQK
jgi:hypothetical protein